MSDNKHSINNEEREQDLLLIEMASVQLLIQNLSNEIQNIKQDINLINGKLDGTTDSGLHVLIENNDVSIDHLEDNINLQIVDISNAIVNIPTCLVEQKVNVLEVDVDKLMKWAKTLTN